MLRVDSLVKTYRKRRVVDGVSLEIHPGEVVGLLGKNGAGKTTTFRMTLGLIDPDSGDVLLDGKKITHLPMYKRARMGISFLPQEPSVFRTLSVRDNVLSILETQKIARRDRMKRLDELLAELDLARLADSKAHMLSGGERRRLEITRALVLSPQLLLLAAPVAALDPIVGAAIQGVVRRLRDRGIGVLLTDHSVHATLQVTDRSYIINEGRILVHGSSSDLISNAEARRVYLGETFTMPAIEVRRNDQTRTVSALEAALALFKNGQYEAALIQSLRAGDASAPVPRLRSACPLLRREYDEAAVEADKALAVDPRSARAHYYRGLVDYGRGRPAEALERFAAAKGLDPALEIPPKFTAGKDAMILRTDLFDPEA